MKEDPRDHEAVRQMMGAYLFNGLDSQETQVFEDHLAECDSCASELASLQSLPGLLDSVPLDTATALAAGGPQDRDSSPESDPEASNIIPLMGELAARRRQSRRRTFALLAGVAAAFLGIGVIAGPLLTQGPGPDEKYTMTSTAGTVVKLDLLKKGWGTELDVEGSSLPTQGTLSLWVKDSSGNYDRAASWSATAQGQVKVVGATPITIDNMAEIEIRDANSVSVASISRSGA
ncbi:MAG: zf-HC2 domain-containing protein [Renibacterium sp.]|nr:zf-HC2 domain-containing protein [Renibacterium sp.]